MAERGGFEPPVQVLARTTNVVKGTDPVAIREAERQAAEEARRKTDRTIRKLAELWLSSKESKAAPLMTDTPLVQEQGA